MTYHTISFTCTFLNFSIVLHNFLYWYNYHFSKIYLDNNMKITQDTYNSIVFLLTVIKHDYLCIKNVSIFHSGIIVHKLRYGKKKQVSIGFLMNRFEICLCRWHKCNRCCNITYLAFLNCMYYSHTYTWSKNVMWMWISVYFEWFLFICCLILVITFSTKFPFSLATVVCQRVFAQIWMTLYTTTKEYNISKY